MTLSSFKPCASWLHVATAVAAFFDRENYKNRLDSQGPKFLGIIERKNDRKVGEEKKIGRLERKE